VLDKDGRASSENEEKNKNKMSYCHPFSHATFTLHYKVRNLFMNCFPKIGNTQRKTLITSFYPLILLFSPLKRR